MNKIFHLLKQHIFSFQRVIKLTVPDAHEIIEESLSLKVRIATSRWAFQNKLSNSGDLKPCEFIIRHVFRAQQMQTLRPVFCDAANNSSSYIAIKVIIELTRDVIELSYMALFRSHVT